MKMVTLTKKSIPTMMIWNTMSMSGCLCKNASLFCDTIASSLADADPEHSGFISRTPRITKKNWQLSIRNTRHQWRNPSLKNPAFLQIVFPFRYLIDDYNLTYYAALCRLFRRNRCQLRDHHISGWQAG